jgi:hypothetical protein
VTPGNPWPRVCSCELALFCHDGMCCHAPS